jgi:hypothetical protein
MRRAGPSEPACWALYIISLGSTVMAVGALVVIAAMRQFI